MFLIIIAALYTSAVTHGVACTVMEPESSVCNVIDSWTD
jgi:hypothetical protein